MPGSDDPTVIRSIAVSTDDVLAAFDLTRQRGRNAVLRVTPPFSGRMRARLHVSETVDYEEEPAPVHVPPERLLAEDAPAYPQSTETEDALRADPDVEYTVERHRTRHAQAVETWRTRAREYVADQTTIETSGTLLTVDVVELD